MIVYYHMWHDGKLAADQCEGCTFFNGQVSELSYLHSRDVTFATFCQAPSRRASPTHDFMGWQMPWYWAPDSAGPLLAGRWFGMLVCYLRDGERIYETYWTSGRATEVMAPSYGLLDMTVYGRQETWEDSPDGWPQLFATSGEQFRRDGRPIAQWERLAAGRSDDLGTAGARASLVSSVGYLAGPAVVGEGLADPPTIPTSGSLWRDSRAWITAGPRAAGVLSVMAWITSPRTRGSGSPASSSNLVHTRSSSARTWQVHRFLHASWRARLSLLRDSSSSPSIASLAVRPSPAGRPTPTFSAILLHRPTIQTIAPSRSGRT